MPPVHDLRWLFHMEPIAQGMNTAKPAGSAVATIHSHMRPIRPCDDRSWL